MSPAVAVPSAARLGIEAWERAALLALIPRLRDGTAKLDMRRPVDLGEGMSLGAQVAEAAGLDPVRYDMRGRSAALVALFAPNYRSRHRPGIAWLHPGWRATPEQGARAIEAFLAGEGALCWDFMLDEAEAAAQLAEAAYG